MPSYIIRGIDHELWRKVKARAAVQGLSIKALVERLLNDWLNALDR